jgi:hypothetical protein
LRRRKNRYSLLPIWSFVRAQLYSPPEEQLVPGNLIGQSALGKTMASDDKKIKANLAPKNEVPPKNEKKTKR